MQIKTFFVLSLACSLLSGSVLAFEYEDSTPAADEYNDNYSYYPAEFSEPKNDQIYAERSSRTEPEFYRSPHVTSGHSNYSSRLPRNIPAPGERLIIINPRNHVWGAYTAGGKLIRAGLATAGARWCSDLGRPCRTKTGVFRIYSLGGSDCISSKFPIGEGGAPMPYCMFFNGGQGLHGSEHLAEANISHGCVRVSVNDAEWIRYNFAQHGTKIIIKSY